MRRPHATAPQDAAAGRDASPPWRDVLRHALRAHAADLVVPLATVLFLLLAWRGGVLLLSRS